MKRKGLFLFLLSAVMGIGVISASSAYTLSNTEKTEAATSNVTNNNQRFNIFIKSDYTWVFNNSAYIKYGALSDNVSADIISDADTDIGSECSYNGARQITIGSDTYYVLTKSLGTSFTTTYWNNQVMRHVGSADYNSCQIENGKVWTNALNSVSYTGDAVSNFGYYYKVALHTGLQLENVSYSLVYANDYLPANPSTISGYYFDGWYTDEELTSEYTKTTLTGDINLYAKYVAKSTTKATIYLTDNKFGSTPYCYAWYKDGQTPLGEMPGTAMTYVYTNNQFQWVYKISIPIDVAGFLFTNSNKSLQSNNITTVTDSAAYYLDGDTSPYTARTWTLYKNATVIYNSNYGVFSGKTFTDCYCNAQYNAWDNTGDGAFVRDGYILSKWNTAADGSGRDIELGEIGEKQSSLKGVVTGASSSITTIYAIWQERSQYTITYDGNGHTGGVVPNSSTQYVDEGFTTAKNTLTKNNYEFAGWSDGTNTYDENQTIAAGTITEDKTLTAQWTIPDGWYLEGFVPSGTSWNHTKALELTSGSDSEGTYYEGVFTTSVASAEIRIAEASSGSLSYGDYGECVNNTGDELVYKFSKSSSNKDNVVVTTPASYLVRVYKIANGNSYTYSYRFWLQKNVITYCSGYFGSGYVAPTIHNYGETVKLSSSTFSSANRTSGSTYEQDGWSLSENGSKAYDLGYDSYSENKNITLYPHWRQTECVVTIGVSGSGSLSTSTITNVPVGSTFSTSGNILTISSSGSTFATVTATPVSKTGYDVSFTGWQITGGNITENWQINTAIFSEIAHTFNIAFDGNGGTGILASQTATYGSSLTLSANSFVKTGYTFAGWLGTNGKVYSDAATIPASDINELYTAKDGTSTLVAQWEQNNTTITLNYTNGGSGTTSTVATYGSSTLLDTPTASKNLMEFAGYYTAASDGTKIINADGSLVKGVSGYTNASGQWINTNSSVTLYAQYTSATIYISENGASWTEMTQNDSGVPDGYDLSYYSSVDYKKGAYYTFKYFDGNKNVYVNGNNSSLYSGSNNLKIENGSLIAKYSLDGQYIDILLSSSGSIAVWGRGLETSEEMFYVVINGRKIVKTSVQSAGYEWKVLNLTLSASDIITFYNNSTSLEYAPSFNESSKGFTYSDNGIICNADGIYDIYVQSSTGHTGDVFYGTGSSGQTVMIKKNVVANSTLGVKFLIYKNAGTTATLSRPLETALSNDLVETEIELSSLSLDGDYYILWVPVNPSQLDAVITVTVSSYSVSCKIVDMLKDIIGDITTYTENSLAALCVAILSYGDSFCNSKILDKPSYLAGVNASLVAGNTAEKNDIIENYDSTLENYLISYYKSSSSKIKVAYTIGAFGDITLSILIDAEAGSTCTIETQETYESTTEEYEAKYDSKNGYYVADIKFTASSANDKFYCISVYENETEIGYFIGNSTSKGIGPYSWIRQQLYSGSSTNKDLASALYVYLNTAVNYKAG